MNPKKMKPSNELIKNLDDSNYWNQ